MSLRKLPEIKADANLPGALSHTIPVNSITEGAGFLGDLGRLATGRRGTHGRCSRLCCAEPNYHRRLASAPSLCKTG